MLHEKTLTRREFVCSAAATTALIGAAGKAAGKDESINEYSHIRGFNYQPSYGSHGLETWGNAFDVAVVKKELMRGREFFPTMNAIRLWLSYGAFIREPGAMPERFHRVIDLGKEVGVRFIPTLFNGWHSCPDFGGISVEMLGYWGTAERFEEAFSPYIEGIVKPRANDERILLWDMCNEPFNSAGCSDAKQIVLDWLGRVRNKCRELGANAPISVGSTPSVDSIRTLEPLSDVITFHPYFAWNAWVKTPEEFEQGLDAMLEVGKSVGKPMLATETGWGALDDKKRSEVLAVELGALAKRGVGFVAHLLHHTLVADGHRPEYGPISGAGYMAFVEKDGSLRRHHEIYNSF